MSPDPIGTGGLNCGLIINTIRKLYRTGLHTRNSSHTPYTVSGIRWSCYVLSYARHDGYYSSSDSFNCDGRVAQSNTLTQEFNFFLNPQRVTVSCSEPGFCTEQTPVLNGDYGDQKDYAAAGLTLQSGRNGSGPGPLAGNYNRLALCVWKDLGSAGLSENWRCEYP